MTTYAAAVLLVLCAAVTHASWNALVKADGDRMAMMGLISATTCALGGLMALAFPFPAWAAWPYLIASSLIHYGYKALLLLAYRAGDLGRTYPIARGSAPLMVALLSSTVAGEAVIGPKLPGVVLISLGVLSLALEGGPRQALRNPAALGFALATGICTAAYTLVDGTGVRLSGSPIAYSGWLFMLDGLPWTVLCVWLMGTRSPRLYTRMVVTGLGAGVLSLFGYAAVIFAMSLAPIASIAALRETSVVIAAGIGALWLGEPFGVRRIAAASAVAVGVAIVALA